MFKVDRKKKDQKKDQNILVLPKKNFGPSLTHAIRLVKEGPKEGPKFTKLPFLSKTSDSLSVVFGLKYFSTSF